VYGGSRNFEVLLPAVTRGVTVQDPYLRHSPRHACLSMGQSTEALPSLSVIVPARNQATMSGGHS
jgi:hypothetical protein